MGTPAGGKVGSESGRLASLGPRRLALFRCRSDFMAPVSLLVRSRLSRLAPAPPRRPLSTADGSVSRRSSYSSSRSPVAICITRTALPITSAGRFSPLGLGAFYNPAIRPVVLVSMNSVFPQSSHMIMYCG